MQLSELLTSKTPPHSIESERAILGAALVDGNLALAAIGLESDAFCLEQHRKVFEAMVQLAASGETVDLLTVSEALRATNSLDEVGGAAFLAALVDAAGILPNLPTYARLVREAASKRTLIQLGTHLVGSSYNGKRPDAIVKEGVEGLARVQALLRGRERPNLLGMGLGEFLAQEFRLPEPYIQGLLNSEGSGFLAGEEKLGKSLYALHEGLSMALGMPVAGRFPVPARRRVLFIEEEDSPRRVWARVRALLRGLGLDPDDTVTGTELGEWFRVSIWDGFTLDDAGQLARLDATLEAFPADVVYLDVLRKLTTRDLNKAQEAGALLASLDELRRRRAVVFRVLHHFRKSQGFRIGRGSQEMAASYVLGAWSEASLFFEPIGRKQGAVRVEVQTKDGAPVPGFRLKIHSEGPLDAPTSLALVAEDLAEDISLDDRIQEAVATLEKTEAQAGKPGVSVAALVSQLKKSDKSIRRGFKRLQEVGLVSLVGHAPKGVVLYGVSDE